MQAVPRLIKTFVPDTYTLSLTLERTARTFQGTVTIKGNSPAGKPIRLHQKALTITSATLDGKEASFTTADDEVSISHPDLTTGAHIVTVQFSGLINDEMHGMYPCYYEHDGVKKELLATQFESHHAREVFPCIDEPEAKATFDVTLITEPDVTVLGNMPIKLRRQENGVLVTTFDTTPRMSTYLVAWVVGELHRKTATTRSGVEVNIWATPAQPPQTLDFALDIATRSIDFFDDYFDTPYPLPKADHVALPDFSSGAMENWGLITYREVALLADPKTSALSTRQQAALVIAHELSHQWFGNLVTMKWWNDLWLNESFANFMEYVAIDALQPEWRIWLDYATREVPYALNRDSLDGVQAIQSDVSHPDEISSLFDPAIVYAKGGRLLRMLQTHIGTEAFQKGLQVYFSTHAYKNTVADDLWRCFSDASGQDISTLMHAWISQPGFPLVTARQEDKDIILTQERFFIGPHAPSTTLWPIPLASTQPAVPSLLDSAEQRFAAPADPLLLNHDSASHFITRYAAELHERVMNDIESLSDLDRLAFLSEHSLLCQAGIIPTAALIPLLDRYRHESLEAIWNVMAGLIGQLKKFVETDEAAEHALKTFVGSLASEQYARLGWAVQSGETESDTKLRATIISLMLYSEQADVIAAATKTYASTPIDELDSELRPSILANAVRHGVSEAVVDDLLSLYRRTASSDLREDIASGLTATRDPAVAAQLLELLKDKNTIRPQDAPYWFVWLLMNRYNRELAWSWARQEWSWIKRTYGGDKSYDIFPRYIASSLITHVHLQEYVSFFTPLKEDLSLKRNIEIGITELTSRVELVERDGPAVRSALLDL